MNLREYEEESGRDMSIVNTVKSNITQNVVYKITLVIQQ